MPDDGFVGSVASRLGVEAEVPVDGALCCIDAPPCSRLIPVPCALAKPALATSAIAAAEIKKRLLMEYLLTCLHCPHRQRSVMRDVPREVRFRRVCFF
jgi:hypothetical protein